MELSDYPQETGTILLICGSRHATPAMTKFAITCVERAKANGWGILVGDAEGVDKAVRSAAERLQADYAVVTVHGHNRLRGEAYTSFTAYHGRDQQMCQFANRGMFIHNGSSRGTKACYDYFLTLPNKVAHLRQYSEVVKSAKVVYTEDWYTNAEGVKSQWEG